MPKSYYKAPQVVIPYVKKKKTHSLSYKYKKSNKLSYKYKKSNMLGHSLLNKFFWKLKSLI